MDDVSEEYEENLSLIEGHILLVRSVVGIGTLTMPLAFCCVGIYYGCLFSLLSTLILFHGINILVKCMLEANSRNEDYFTLSIAETMNFAFKDGPGSCAGSSKALGFLVDFLLVLTHYILYMVFIIFIAECLYSVSGFYWVRLDLRFSILLVGLITLPIIFVRELSQMIEISLIANVFVHMCLINVIIEFLQIDFDSDLFARPDHISLMPLFIGFILFSYTNVGVMATVASKVEGPKKITGWRGILSYTALVVFFVNTLIGALGYLCIGEQMIVRILDNLSAVESETHCVKCAMAVAIYLSIPLNAYVPMEIIMMQLNLSEANGYKVDIILRIVFIVLGTLNAAAVPVMMPFLKLFGTLTVALINIILPACMENAMFKKRHRNSCMMIKNIFMILVGIVVLVCGLYSAVFDIMVEYWDEPVENDMWTKLNEYDE